MRTDDLFWGEIATTPGEDKREARAALGQGKLVPALLLEGDEDLERELTKSLDKIARRTENRLLLMAQALEIADVFSDYAIVVADRGKPTMHLLDSPAGCREAARENVETACGQKHRRVLSALRGSFARDGDGIQVCSSCQTSARAAEALGEEPATIPGVDRKRIVQEARERLARRRYLTEATLENAIVAAITREASVALAAKADSGGKQLVRRILGDEYYESLVEEKPDFEKNLGTSVWRRFFAEKSRQRFSFGRTRAVLAHYARNGFASGF